MYFSATGKYLQTLLESGSDTQDFEFGQLNIASRLAQTNQKSVARLTTSSKNVCAKIDKIFYKVYDFLQIASNSETEF